MSNNSYDSRTIFPSIIFILTPILGVGSLLCWTLIAHRRGTLVPQLGGRGRTWRNASRIAEEDLEGKNRIKPALCETWISSADEEVRGVVMDSIMPLAIQAQRGEDPNSTEKVVDTVDEEEPYMVSLFICMPSETHPHHTNAGNVSSREGEDWREDASLALGTANVVIEGPIAWSIPNAITNKNPNKNSTPTPNPNSTLLPAPTSSPNANANG